MVTRIGLALLAGVIAFLVCVFFGGLLVTTGVPLAVYVGQFLVQWATLISVIVAVLAFFGHGRWFSVV